MNAEEIIRKWKLIVIIFGEKKINETGQIARAIVMKNALITIGGGTVENYWR